METKAVLIKKYENRRLYDTTNSRYVNLDEVAQMLQRGEDVKVVDAATGEDITRLILTQIIVEDAKTTDSNFPMDVLRQMVIASGKAGQEGTLKYMKSILDFYQDTYRVMTPPVNPFDFMSGQVAGHRGGAASTRTTAADRAPENPRTPPVVPADAEEVTEMKRRLAELEDVVSRIAPKPPPRKKKARKPVK
ncbi:MAG TPA: polyhydroxyalkanoate synthesis regulator DNA-binding domain-containing protein [Acidobacteriaceae bacterium]